VHASCPIIVKDECDLRVKDNNFSVYNSLWAREKDDLIPFRCRIGNKDYFSIVGHTPNENKYGFYYDKKGNYLNIDGGCSYYVGGLFEYNHVPLVEVKDNCLRILTFNNHNEIIYGNYFNGDTIIPFSEEELKHEKTYLNHEFKPKKLIKLPDGVIGYEDWK
jgi:hypothetical protein